MLQVSGNTKNSLNVKTIGFNAYETLIKLKSPASVEGAFDNSFYIKVDENKLIRVIRYGEYVSANSIVISEDDRDFSFKSMGVKEGMEVVCKNSDILIGDKFVITSIDNITKWQSPPVPDKGSISELEIIKLNLRVLRDVIYTCPSREGLVPLLENVELIGSIELFLKPQEDSFVERARPGIERMMWGLFSYDIDAIIKSAKTIIGFGPGLTPSCDDFLSGLILSLKIGKEVLDIDSGQNNGFFDEVARRIYTEAQGKTTIFSLSMLRETCNGVCPLVVNNLIYSLLTKDANQTADVSKTLIKMGETSGADIAIGVFYGIRFLISEFENLEVLDEIA